MRLTQWGFIVGLGIALGGTGVAFAQQAAPVVGGAVRIEADGVVIDGTLLDKLPSGYLVRLADGRTTVVPYDKVRSIEAESAPAPAATPATAATPPPPPKEPPDVAQTRQNALDAKARASDAGAAVTRKTLPGGKLGAPVAHGAYTDPPYLGGHWGKGDMTIGWVFPLQSVHEKSRIVGSFDQKTNVDFRIEPEWRLADNLDMSIGYWMTEFSVKVNAAGYTSYSVFTFTFPLWLRGYLRFGHVRPYLGLGGCISIEGENVKPSTKPSSGGFGYGVVYQLGMDWSAHPDQKGFLIGGGLEGGGPQLEEHFSGEKPTNIGPVLPLGLGIHLGGVF